MLWRRRREGKLEGVELQMGRDSSKFITDKEPERGKGREGRNEYE